MGNMLSEIEFQNHINDYAALHDLYRQAGLGQRSQQEIGTAFAHSPYIVSAVTEGRLLGAGRAFGDEVDCAVICDMAVLPEAQGKKIGSQILRRLIDMTRHHLRIILYANPGKEGFYLQHGFHRMKTAMMTSDKLPLELGRQTGFIE